jgi:hypothetical protein
MGCDFKEIRQRIKGASSQETAMELLMSLGVEVRRDCHFKENNSFSVSKSGNIKDFGSTDFSGDIVAFMIEILGIPAQEALEWTARSLGVWND